MNEQHWSTELKERLVVFAKLLVCLIIDSFFLLSWAYVSRGVHNLIEHLKDWDPLITSLFEYTLEISTFASVAIFIVFDIAILIRRYMYQFKSMSPRDDSNEL
jgi:hypothetical protein